MIDPTALIGLDALLADDVVVGPYAVVGLDGDGPGTSIGPGAVVRSHSVIYRGTAIGGGFRSGHGVLVREHTVIGESVSVGSHSVVEHHVQLADGVRLHSRCFVPEFSVLEPGAWLGPGVIVTNARFPNRPDTKRTLEGVRIGKGAVVGAGAVLLPGIVIGEGALVGAGAVVTKDVKPGVTVAGNPARSLR